MVNKIIISGVGILAVLLMGFGHVPKENSKATTADFYQQKDTITWTQLGKIDFVKKKSPVYGEVMFPVINSTLKGKQKKRIVAKGFIVPIDNKTYALSKNVFAQCFFCGNAGPETIMGIKFRGATPRLKTDLYVTIEGTFRYNDNDIEDWIYHIEDAVIVKQK